MKPSRLNAVAWQTAMPTRDYVIEQVSFRLAPVNGLALLHLACGLRTYESTDVELKYCPTCQVFMDDYQIGGRA